MKEYRKFYKCIIFISICISISGCSPSETKKEGGYIGDELPTDMQENVQMGDEQIAQEYTQSKEGFMEEVQSLSGENSWQSQPPEKYCGNDFTEFSYLGGDYRLYKKSSGNYAQLMLLHSAKDDVVIPEKIPYENEEYTLVAVNEIAQESGNGYVLSIEIPDSVVWLNEKLFSGFSNLQSVHLPNELKHIPAELFGWCRSLSSVNIPQNLISIGAGAFRSAAGGINNLVIDIPNTVESIGEYAFTEANISRINIPDNIKIIGDEAFSGASIEEIILPCVTNKDNLPPVRLLKGSHIRIAELKEGWEEIPDEMFAECKMLRAVRLPDSVKKIGTSAFNEDSALLYINMPKNLEEIGFGAFSKCELLQDIILPEKVKTIGAYVFSGCKNAIIRANGNIENVEDGAFEYCKEVHLRQMEVIAYCQNKFPDITFILEEEIYSAEPPFPEGLENTHRDGFSLNDLNIQSKNSEQFTGGFNQEDSISLSDNQGNRYWQGYSLGASSSEPGAFVTYNIEGKYKKFTGIGAVDADAAEEEGSVGFCVYGDDTLLYKSKYFNHEETQEPFDIDISGVQTLKIEYVDDRDVNDSYGMNFIPETKLCTIFDGYLYE